MAEPWDADINTARESQDEELSEPGYDGNQEYSESGTYGQPDYTVREREDGTFDVYIASDSERGHSHDHVDSDGNILDHYHDYINLILSNLTSEQLDYISSKTTNECVKIVVEELQNSKKRIR